MLARGGLRVDGHGNVVQIEQEGTVSVPTASGPSREPHIVGLEDQQARKSIILAMGGELVT